MYPVDCVKVPAPGGRPGLPGGRSRWEAWLGVTGAYRFVFQTRMQSLRPEPAARYRNVLEALWRIVRTEGVWRPMRGLNITATGAGPAHALYFACYEKLKKTLSDVIHAGGNSHVANGTRSAAPCTGPAGPGAGRGPRGCGRGPGGPKAVSSPQLCLSEPPRLQAGGRARLPTVPTHGSH